MLWTASLLATSSFFLVWLFKQSFMLPMPKPDPFTGCNYMLGIWLPHNASGFLNSLRFWSIVPHGGRVIIGGSDCWRAKGGVFVRVQTRADLLKKLKLYDTGILVTCATSDKLNELVGEPVQAVLNDCAKINPGFSFCRLMIQKLLTNGVALETGRDNG